MIKENQFITLDEAIRAGWQKESEGRLSGKPNLAWEIWVSPDEELMCHFFIGEMSALVERTY